ncbi:MAG: MoxR family ATPase, partial [Planctomycetaceae bacterium]|nr:MoxR family ATPase [Planctomycetaceae bacterium]
ERQVTVDAIQHRLADEFFVIATQNPTEQHGTYPLPEAQLDRFAMKLSIGYPDPSAEMEVLKAARESNGELPDSDGPILEEGQLRQIQKIVAGLYVDEKLQDYLVRLAAETRSHPHIVLGLSPRGMLTWQRAAQSRAFLNHRSFVTPDDIQDVAEPVLSVRLGIDHEDPLPTIREILETISVPEYTVPE